MDEAVDRLTKAAQTAIAAALGNWEAIWVIEKELFDRIDSHRIKENRAKGREVT